MKNAGYLIPENAQVTGIRCLRVFVPDDPLYIAAFLGAYEYFGQWTAWERDAAHRGAIAASVWKDAIEFTLDGLSQYCGDHPLTEEEMSDILDKLEEINNRLSEIEDMNITVTQTNGCCCDGGETTTTQTDGVTIDPEDTGIIPPYNTDPVDVSDPIRCRATNYLAQMVTETVRAMSGRLGGGALLVLGIVEILIAILSWIDIVPGDEVVGTVIGFVGLITIAQAIARMAGTAMFTWGVIDELAEKLESPAIAQEFVCALSGWSNSAELGNSLSSFISSQIADLDTVQPVRDAMVSVFGLIFDSPLINWFTEHTDSIVPAGFVAQYTCTCGATGDSCPTANIVLAGIGSLPSGDLTGTQQAFASTFNSSTGLHEVVFELAANYCVTIDNGTYTPDESHQKCAGGVMVASDGSCIRRFVARSQTAFATAVTFNQQSADCDSCTGDMIWEESLQGDYCEAAVALTQSGTATQGDASFSGTVAKDSQYENYKWAMRVKPENIAAFAGLGLGFNGSGGSVTIAHGELGQTSSYEIGAIAIDISMPNDLTAISYGINLGIYSAACPKPLDDGWISWWEA